MKSATDELEAGLTALFRAQAESLPVTEAAWTELRQSPQRRVRPLRATVLAAGVAALVALLLAAAVGGLGNPPERVRTGPAAPDDAERSESATTTKAPFHVETRQVSFTAEALTIETGGKRFVTAPPVEVHGDPGNPNEYTTLELTWQEHGVEMRLFVYFTSDGREWWSNEIRTYNGNVNPEWVTYEGEFFRRPLGTPFVGEFTVAATDTAASVHVSNLRLQAFRPSPACVSPTGPLALDPGTSRIEMKLAADAPPGVSSGYGARVRLLDTASCTPVPDEDRYVYEWQTRDPDVVDIDRRMAEPVGFPGSRADLRAVGQGQTAVRVTARDPATGAVVDETDIEVVVG